MLTQIENTEVIRKNTHPEIEWYVKKQLDDGVWSQETLPAEVVGLSRPITVYRASRKTNIITYDWHGDKNTFCPPMWWDLAIGSGACGLGCRACFLMLTHRIRRDPWRHLLYNNFEDFYKAVTKWLLVIPDLESLHTAGALWSWLFLGPLRNKSLHLGSAGHALLGTLSDLGTAGSEVS